MKALVINLFVCHANGANGPNRFEVNVELVKPLFGGGTSKMSKILRKSVQEPTELTVVKGIDPALELQNLEVVPDTVAPEGILPFAVEDVSSKDEMPAQVSGTDVDEAPAPPEVPIVPEAQEGMPAQQHAQLGDDVEAPQTEPEPEVMQAEQKLEDTGDRAPASIESDNPPPTPTEMIEEGDALPSEEVNADAQEGGSELPPLDEDNS